MSGSSGSSQGVSRAVSPSGDCTVGDGPRRRESGENTPLLPKAAERAGRQGEGLPVPFLKAFRREAEAQLGSEL